MRTLGQKGFTMLEVLVTVTILGILASLAVPRFANARVMANTAKVASDLQALDTAIAIFEMENGRSPLTLNELSDYVTDVENLKPPVGTCQLKDGTTISPDSSTVYTITSLGPTGDGPAGQCRAYCLAHTAGDFGKKE